MQNGHFIYNVFHMYLVQDLGSKCLLQGLSGTIVECVCEHN